MRPGQVVGVMYSRTIEQAFGLSSANNLVDNVSGNYTVALRRNLTSTFSGTFTFAKDPLQPDRHVTGQVAQVALAYRFLEHLSLSGGTAVYSRVSDTEGRVTSTSTYLGLNYVTTWR